MKRKRTRANDDDFVHLVENHTEKPIWVLPNLEIYLEVNSDMFEQASSFLGTVADPKSRLAHIHKYKLTQYSLLAAVSLEFTEEKILKQLKNFSKNDIPDSVSSFINSSIAGFGNVKIVFSNTQLYVESSTRKMIETLFEKLKSANLCKREGVEILCRAAFPQIDTDVTYLSSDGSTVRDDTPNTTEQFCFEVNIEKVEEIKKIALDSGIPLLEEFSWKSSLQACPLPLSLNSDIELRYYQKEALSRVFHKGRARSGLLVLPCGAGKTLTGIAICATMRESTIILCTSGVAVKQWKDQLCSGTSIDRSLVCVFTAKEKDEFPFDSVPCVLITTYNMLAVAIERRSKLTKVILERIRGRSWGLLVCDEVHVVPARLFRTVCTAVSAKCKIGLTATLLREDGLIMDLNVLIGPKLYETIWLELTKKGYLANILCKEVVCPMTGEFFREYLSQKNRFTKSLLAILNPNKILACESLVQYHEDKGDKILVFCDNIFALQELEKRLKRKVIHGKTPNSERIKVLASFEHNLSRKTGTVIISKVGDVAINLPSASVLIQMSSHYGSRRQETQRLGRILRPKTKVIKPLVDPSIHDAFFYTLVSSDTEEKYFSLKRKEYLLNNGYPFRMSNSVSHLTPAKKNAVEESFFFSATFQNMRSKKQQLTLLARILTHSASLNDAEEKELSESSASSRVEGHTRFTRNRVEKRAPIQIAEVGDSESSSDEDVPQIVTRRSGFGELTGGEGLEFTKYQ